jgi:hypothetical protein
MERGSSKHGAREDDALAQELSGLLGPGGSNREEWNDPEGPADDDAPARVDVHDGGDRDPVSGTTLEAGAARDRASDQDGSDGDPAGDARG